MSIVGKLIALEMIVYDTLVKLTLWISLYYLFGLFIEYLIDKSMGRKKERKSFLGRSGFVGYILKSDKIICVTRICTMSRFTMSNTDKTILSVVNY